MPMSELMPIVLYVLYVIVAVAFLFGLTIFAHELGHFLAARRLGLLVETFSIGFGPSILKWKRGGVTYKIGILPIGGYVALPQIDLGEEEKDEAAPDAAKTESAQTPGAPDAKEEKEAPVPIPPAPPFKRILVCLAGPLGNMIMAYLIAWIVYVVGKPSAPAERMCTIGYVYTNSEAWQQGLRLGDTILTVGGKPAKNWSEFMMELQYAGSQAKMEARSSDGALKIVSLSTDKTHRLGIRTVDGLAPIALAQIKNVDPDSPAFAAGLKMGDIIREIDGVPIMSPEHMTVMIAEHDGLETPIVFERNRTRHTTSVTPHMDPELGRARIGLMFDLDAVEDAVVHIPPMVQIRDHSTLIFRVLRLLVTPKSARATADQMGGPLMIIYMFQKVVRLGFIMALWFTCLLNVNLAILNLLPIPVLDGGHILFAGYETIARRPIPPRVFAWSVRVFAAILIGVMLLLTCRDAKRIFPVERIFRWIGSEPAITNAMPEKPAITNAPARIEAPATP